MWADLLQQAEKLYLLRLGAWGALATLAGTAVLVIAQGPRRSQFLRGFGWICVICGFLELVIALAGYQGVPLRDISGATRLDRLTWLQLGLFIGLAGVGVTLAVTARVMRVRADASNEPPLSSVGAGAAMALHGLALATLKLLLIADISR